MPTPNQGSIHWRRQGEASPPPQWLLKRGPCAVHLRLASNFIANLSPCTTPQLCMLHLVVGLRQLCSKFCQIFYSALSEKFSDYSLDSIDYSFKKVKIPQHCTD